MELLGELLLDLASDVAGLIEGISQFLQLADRLRLTFLSGHIEALFQDIGSIAELTESHEDLALLIECVDLRVGQSGRFL